MYLVDTYQAANAASALAANGLLRYSFCAAFPLFTLQSEFDSRCSTLPAALADAAVYAKLGIAWATSLLAFCTLALLPVPWVLFVWGEGIRRSSGYETLSCGSR
jgi:hypothetical protein